MRKGLSGDAEAYGKQVILVDSANRQARAAGARLPISCTPLSPLRERGRE
jgi:hypothetical protein